MEFAEYAFLSILVVTACAVLLGGVVELFERLYPRGHPGQAGGTAEY